MDILAFPQPVEVEISGQKEEALFLSLGKWDLLPGTQFYNIYLGGVLGFPGGSACILGDLGLMPGLGRSLEGGHGYPLQCSWPGESHGQRRLGGYSPCSHRVGHD